MSVQPAARVVKPWQLDANTPQTPGMRRLAAVSHDLAGSKKLWAGAMLAPPAPSSAVHPPGPLETGVYVVAGLSKVRWGSRLEYEVDLSRGDFLFIPPFLPHQEINPSPAQQAHWVVVRSAQEAV